jgi:hypothetical protein
LLLRRRFIASGWRSLVGKSTERRVPLTHTDPFRNHSQVHDWRG